MCARCIRLSLLIVCILCKGAAATQSGASGTFLIRLSHDLKPEKAVIHTGFYDKQSLIMDYIHTRKGVFDYPLDLEVGKNLRLLIYCPGYKIVTAEFEGSFQGREFSPRFEPLPALRVEGLLVDSAGHPVQHRTLHAKYSLTEEMSYFGFYDGHVTELDIDAGITDAKGAFLLNVPSFAEDPFFENKTTRGRFTLHDRIESDEGYNVYLDPDFFSFQKAYSKPLRLVEYRLGRLSGRLGPEFFHLHNLDRELIPYDRRNNGITTGILLWAKTEAQGGSRGYNLNFQEDGTFDRELPPGIYDLNLSVPTGSGSAMGEAIPIQSGVVVQEGHRQVITMP
jgi:hypothetical protein